ncbi:hypothetical protein, variant [Verruconis gallopava]|nr:hypothetical protein, variant [Verruconis gallopava]KIW07044.1 hypothetical protein, variant [Verruconis gallopava]
MPEDRDPLYTSPWAGANVVPSQSKEGTIQSLWEKETFHELLRLVKSEPGAGVWIQEKTTYYLNHAGSPDQLKHWFKDMVFDYQILSKDQVPAFADWGVRYGTIGLDPSIYLHWLQSKCLDNGVKFQRRTLKHINEAFYESPDPGSERSRPRVVVNCSGVLASKLGGVKDDNIIPMRGQLVIVANESKGMFSLYGLREVDESIGECIYIIDRPAGGGTAIGGSYYPTWSTEPDMELAGRLLKRAIQICPNLDPDGKGVEALEIVRHQVGLRPNRNGGERIEIEEIKLPGGENEVGKVVHCYGCGGAGFQRSYGIADKAVSLVRDCLNN